MEREGWGSKNMEHCWTVKKLKNAAAIVMFVCQASVDFFAQQEQK